MRFSQFVGNWVKVRIKDILKILYGKDYKDQDAGNIPVYGTGGIICYINNHLCNWACACIGRKGTINKPIYIAQPFWCVDTLFYSKSKNNNSPKFQYYLFQTINWKKFNEASGVPSLSSSTIENIKIFIPNTDEQKKIADFLSLIDQRIDTQSKIIEDLESQIKWIRYKIFNYSNKIPNHKLAEYLIDYTEKNTNNFYSPVAVGKYGIRKREDIYSKELATDYSKNKVIYKNTLIIGMGSTQIDIGILFDDEKFCVSPAYTTYKIKNINSIYLNELLIFLNPLLSKKYMIISSRQGKSVNKEELLSHCLFVHPNEEQDQIATLFRSFYKLINKEKDILELYKKQKAYLLKNMFI